MKRQKLKLTLNIGVPDAEHLGLNPENATEGTVVDVDEKVAAVLIRNGWGIAPADDSTSVKPSEKPQQPIPTAVTPPAKK